MNHADVAQLVERDLAKVEVAGSSPVVRSNSWAVFQSRRFSTCSGHSTASLSANVTAGHCFESTDELSTGAPVPWCNDSATHGPPLLRIVSGA